MVMFISLFFNLILNTQLFIPTDKNKGGKGFKKSYENYLFEDYRWKVSILTFFLK